MAEFGSSGGKKHFLMKQAFLSFLFLVLSATAGAQDVTYYVNTEIGGIYYDLFEYNHSEWIAKVSSSIKSKYNGNVVIPSSVTWEFPVFHEDAPPTYVNRVFKVIAIGPGAFKDCSELSSISIPASVTEILNYAFDGCSSLTSITIPDGVKEIPDGTFLNCSSLTSVNLPNDLVSIGWQSFKGCSCLSAINLPNSLTQIGNVAFQGCSSLTSIVVPTGVKEIGTAAFEGCTALTSITLPQHLETIGLYAFEGCSELTNLTIPNSVTSIGRSAFANCSKLETIDLPDGLTSIGNNAFASCSSLASITIPDRVTTIGDWAFLNCHSLSSLSLGSNLESIGKEAFSSCESLTTISIPDGVTSIGYKAFADCKGLSSVNIGNGLQSIEERVFESCSGLISVTIGDGVTSIGSYAFAWCNNLAELNLGNSLSTIGEDAFYDCRNLTTLILPSSMSTIGEAAFSDCSGLIDIRINKEVTSIGDFAFHHCSNIKTVTSLIEEPFATGQYAFSHLNEAKLYVPKGTKSKYSETACWNNIKNIIEINDMVNIGASGKSSFSCRADLNFVNLSGVKAYIVTGYEAGTKTVWLTRVNSVPANTPFIVEGSEGEYEVPFGPSFAYLPTNLLKANMTGEDLIIDSEGDGYVNYLLSDGTFRPVAATGGIVRDGKCYLQLPSDFAAMAAGSPVSIRIADSGKSSFCAPVDLDFSDVDGLKAYTATGYDRNGTVWLSRVKKVSKGTALMLEGTGGQTYTIPSEGVQTCYVNMFVGNISGSEISIDATDGYLTNFLLKDGAFHPVAATGGKVGNCRSYLQLPTAYLQNDKTTRSIGADESICKENETRAISIASNYGISEEDGTTGIREVNHAQANESENDTKCFNLQGLRADNPVKGLYIKNGRKIVVR